MRKLIYFFFERYKQADFITRQRSRVLFAIYVSILLIAIPLLTASLTLHTVNPRAFLLPFFAVPLVLVLIVLFQRGYLALSAHTFFIISLTGIWTIILTSGISEHLLERTDTIVLILALMTLTPLIVGRRKLAIVAYFVVNGVLLLVFVHSMYITMGIPGTIVMEYLIDTVTAFIFIGTVSYQIFSINKRSLDRAFNEIEKNSELNITLSRSEARFRALTENSSDLTVILSPEGTCLYASPSVVSFYGYRLEDFAGTSFFRFIHQDEEKPFRNLLDTALQKENVPLPIELVFRHGNGTWLNMEGTLSSMLDTPGVSGMVLTLRDITEKKQTDIQVRNSLHEKEILLKEIHHRVKNNFQIITSLLNLQARQIQDPAFKSIFSDSQNRIRAMALIHEKLYGSGELAFIDIGVYAETLCAELFQLYRPSQANVRLKTSADKILMNISQAIPCGLILNELVSNALKHAFPQSYDGEGLIEVSLKENSDGSVVMTVKDNGVGMEEQDEGSPDGSLGLHLITLLSKGQLKGTVQRTVNNGTTYIICIPPGGPPGER